MKKRNKLMKKHFRKTNSKENKHIEELIAKDNSNAIERAKEVMVLENVKYSEPIVVVVPNTSTNRRVRFKTTKIDNEVRIDYDYATVHTIFLGERSLFLHESSIDYLISNVEKDVANEIAYEDIVRVETFIGYDKPNNPKLKSVLLTLHIKNGNSISIPLRNHYLFGQDEVAEILTEKENYIIGTIKKAIRTVK